MADNNYNDTQDENMPAGNKGGQSSDERTNARDLEDTDEKDTM